MHYPKAKGDLEVNGRPAASTSAWHFTGFLFMAPIFDRMITPAASP
jgi:hypothetical protein